MIAWMATWLGANLAVSYDILYESLPATPVEGAQMEAGCGIDLKAGEAYAQAYGIPPIGVTMSQEREASLFRNGRNQAVRIPREFEFSGERVIMRKVGRRLILEPMPKRKLADVLAELQPLPPGETLPDVDEGLRPLDRDPLG